MKKVFFSIVLSAFYFSALAQQFQLKSPNGKIELNVTAQKNIEWSLKYEQSELVKKGNFSFLVNENTDLASNLKVKAKKQSQQVENIECLVPTKFKHLQISYNVLLIDFNNNLSVEFRLYNDGFAYRTITSLKKGLTILNEVISLEFPESCKVGCKI